MTQVVIKKEKPCILAEEFFEAGLFVVEYFGENQVTGNTPFITSYDTDKEEMLLIMLGSGQKIHYEDNDYEKFIILEKGTVLEITV